MIKSKAHVDTVTRRVWIWQLFKCLLSTLKIMLQSIHPLSFPAYPLRSCGALELIPADNGWVPMFTPDSLPVHQRAGSGDSNSDNIHQYHKKMWTYSVINVQALKLHAEQKRHPSYTIDPTAFVYQRLNADPTKLLIKVSQCFHSIGFPSLYFVTDGA